MQIKIPIDSLIDSLIERIVPQLKGVIQTELELHRKQNIPKKEYLTVKETAELLAVTKTTIHEYCRRGVITRHKFGKRTLFKREELLSLISEERTQPNSNR